MIPVQASPSISDIDHHDDDDDDTDHDDDKDDDGDDDGDGKILPNWFVLPMSQDSPHCAYIAQARIHRGLTYILHTADIVILSRTTPNNIRFPANNIQTPDKLTRILFVY